MMGSFEFFENVSDKLILMKIHLWLFRKIEWAQQQHTFRQVQVMIWSNLCTFCDPALISIRWQSVKMSDFELRIQALTLKFWLSYSEQGEILSLKIWGKKYSKKDQNSETKKIDFRNSNKFKDKNATKAAIWN